MGTEARVKLIAEDKISSVLKTVGGELDRFGSFAGKISSVLAGGAGFGLAGATAAVVRFASSVDDLDEAAQGLGTTAVTLANLRAGAALAGLGAEQLDKGLGKLNKNLTEAALGGKEAKTLFLAMGISAKDAAGNVRSSADVLGDLANRFRTMREDSAKATLAAKLFGEELGRKFVAYLNEGSDGIERFSGLTDAAVEDAKRLQSQLDKLGTYASRLKLQLGGAAAGAINTIIDKAAVQDTDRQMKILTERVQTLQREMKVRQNPEFLVSINMELAEVERRLGTLKQAGIDRFLSGGNAARKADVAESAEDVLKAAEAALAKEEADKRAKTAAEAFAKELERQGAAARSASIMAEFHDRARIRERRAAGEREISDDALRESERRVARMKELTGRADIERQAQDLKLLDDAFAKREIDFVEHMVGRSKALDLVNESIGKTTDSVEQLGLIFTSALGDFIKDPKASNFFKALTEDVLQFTTKLLILDPILKSIKASVDSNTTGGSVDIMGFLGSLFGGGSTSSAGFSAGFVGSFAAGTPYVPRDGLAMVHRGERIVPAAENHNGAAPVVKIQVVNNTGTPATARQEPTADGGVRVILDAVANDIAGGGRVAGALQNTYALNRGAGVPRRSY